MGAASVSREASAPPRQRCAIPGLTGLHHKVTLCRKVSNLEKPMNTNMQGGVRRRSIWKGPAVITAIILGIPLLRSLFVSGWNWDLRGFVFVGGVGTLLFSIGLTYQMVTRKLGTPAYRAGVGVALVATFFLVWGNFVQAADDVNPAAMMYLAVPLVGIIGAAAARFQPKGMAVALFVAALAQALVL